MSTRREASLCECKVELCCFESDTNVSCLFLLLRDLSNNRLVAIPPNLFVLLEDLLQLWVLFAPAHEGFFTPRGRRTFRQSSQSCCKYTKKPCEDFRERNCTCSLFPVSFDQTALRSVQHRKHTLSSSSWAKESTLEGLPLVSQVAPPTVQN